jgi:hypothetical protein
VIDLGSELAGFDDDRGPLWRAMEAQDDLSHDQLKSMLFNTGCIVPLADLEREGFNTTPPPDWEEMRNNV